MFKSGDNRRKLAAKLANGPAFLLLGEQGEKRIGGSTSSYGWNGVYTSSEEKRVTDLFRSSFRAASAHGAMGRVPSRNSQDLEVRYLFGAEHLPDSERPGKGTLGQAEQSIKCIQELTRLASETITPSGTLLIEGWSAGDRLTPEILAPVLGMLGMAQAHIFSATLWTDNQYISQLIADGRLVPHASTLDEILSDLENTGALRSASNSEHTDHVVALGGGYTAIDINTWNQVRRSARPIDLDVLTPPIFSSSAARYQEFRNFIGATEGSPRWSGIASGMHIVRDFESKVLDEARKRIDSKDLPLPIVIEGQTATGKSVALASIAMELSRSGRAAVLHQARRTVRPSVEDIDSYSAWAEDNGANATVLVWDGMTRSSEYESFARQLHARGRRVLIIGTSYVQPKNEYSRTYSAPIELSRKEMTDLRGLLREYGVSIPGEAVTLDSSFLAFLYHALPETETQLRKGLSREMRAAEFDIAQFARDAPVDMQEGHIAPRLTAMQAAFRAAGMEVRELLPEDEEPGDVARLGFDERAPLQQVTALVLVAGRHGVPVPIDLALRILGREGYESVLGALTSSDILREVIDDNGEIFLSARSHLEAELLSQYEIPIPVEVEVIVEAIRNVRIVEGFGGGADEVQFLVSILERVGPSADDPRYRSHYGVVAEALRQRRLNRGAPLPRLALQESNFVRGFIQWQQNANEADTTSRISALEFNTELLDQVLSSPSTRGLIRLSLSVELASTLGAIIYEYSHGDQALESEELAARLDDVLAAVLDAREIDPGNTYPVDVLAWSTIHAINTASLNSGERINRLAYAVASIESLDRSALSDSQVAKLDSRGVALNNLLAKDDEVWEYLSRLEINSSPAATYYLAQFDAKEGPSGEGRALNRLRTASPEVKKDWRCAQLLVNLTWNEIAGARLLGGERQPLHLTDEHIAKIEMLTSDLHGADLPDLYRLRFIQALAEFMLSHFQSSARLFREVGELTRQLSKRIYTPYLLADDTGVPIVFTGRVEFSDSRSGEVWVNQLGTRVRFEPHLFSSTGEFTRNQELPAFHVGFKLSRGPVAEPRSFYRARNRK